MIMVEQPVLSIKKNEMKIIREIIRILLGATFVFSGFVKGIDPLGSAYKFTDYFNAFGTDWATTFSLVLSIVLALAEFGIGIAILLNYQVKIFSWLCLLFMAFFLPLTLWVAIKNPVTDCGCFGDALVISNWETFFKNIVLMAFAIVVFINRLKYKNKFNFKFQNAYFIFFLLLLGYVQYHGLNHLPLIDFRPYKIGNNINEGMNIPEGAPQDVFKNEFIYKNKVTGKNQKFDETNYPWKDTINWQYVEMNSKLIKKGYHAPIHDFTMENSNGEDVADFFLHEKNYTLILVSNNLSKASKKRQKEINELAEKAKNEGWNFICMTAATSEDIIQFEEQYQPPYEFFFCDEITLKTMIRSNPGLILLKEGTIIDNWHWRDIPAFDKILKQ
jgi:uncharacterized membrane protein YphA (DoxX/SURF4 family)